MAISYSLSHGHEFDLGDNSSNITQGTSAPGTGDVEVRTSTSVNVLQTIEALKQIIRFMEDQVISSNGVVPV